MDKKFQMDWFSVIDSSNRSENTRIIKYDFHHKLIELGFHCSKAGKSYYKRIKYKKYFIDFKLMSRYDNCFYAVIFYSKEMIGLPFSNISFVTNDETGKRIFYNDDIFPNPTYLLSFEDLLSQFIMRYKNVASYEDQMHRCKYIIREEDCLKAVT